MCFFRRKIGRLASNPKTTTRWSCKSAIGATSVLLEGDAEKAVERRIASLHHPRADLLKVGHHGSATSTTPEILQSVHPSFAVISVGFRTSFGLPKLSVLERLQAAGVHVYRTDVNGAVTFYLDGHTVTPYLAAFRIEPGRAREPENYDWNREGNEIGKGTSSLAP